jgi:virulence factor Mce-like protein
MDKQAPSPLRIFTMVVFALSCFGLLLFLWLSFGGAIPLKPKGYRVQVAFEEAKALAAEADVRVAGVPIGKVRSKERDPESSRTIATLELDRRYAPLHADARATLRQKTLLGETFVEMTLGSEDAPPVPEGGRLANERVQPPVELDEILDTLDPYTRKAFRTWQRELGAGVDGRGRDLNEAFANMPGFVEEGGDLMAVLDRQKEALGALVRDSGVVFGALTSREDQLRRLISSQDDVFSAIAAERESFAEAFRIFPTFLDESKKTFRRLDSFSVKAAPVVRELVPAMRDLGPTVESLGDLGPELRGFFRNLDPLITVSRRSLPATTEVLRGLRPLLGELGPFLSQLNPMLQYIGLHVHTLSDMFANLGVATAAKVAHPAPGTVGHYLRQFGPIGPESVAIQPTRSSSNRGNAYLGPLSVLTSPEAQKYKSLPAFDCRNAGGEKEPSTGPVGAPGCRVQQPTEFGGGPPTAYPRLSAQPYDR